MKPGAFCELSRAVQVLRVALGKESLLLLTTALGVRIIVSFAASSIGISGIPWLGLSTWGDFDAGYLNWFNFVHQGLLPYRDFYTYKYPPLFLYALYPFFLVTPQAASIPIVGADAATPIMVYLIAKRFARKRVAFFAGMLYALSPFVLYYVDYLWLSSQPMTFFLVLAIYLLNSDRPLLSSAAFAIAVMFKQEALFVLPAYLLLFIRSKRKEFLKGLGVSFAIVLLVSLPWLIAAPRDYIYSLSYYPISGIFGPGEPALHGSLSVPGAAVKVTTYAPQACGLSTIPGVYTGTLCGTVVNVQQFATSLFVGRLNQVAFFVAPILVALLAPALYVVRKANNLTQMLCLYSMLGGLVLFWQFSEPSLGYYFVPVYAFAFSCISDFRELAGGIAIAVLNLFLLEGPFQVLLPLAFLFFLAIRQDTKKAAASSPPRQPILVTQRASVGARYFLGLRSHDPYYAITAAQKEVRIGT